MAYILDWAAVVCQTCRLVYLPIRVCVYVCMEVSPRACMGDNWGETRGLFLVTRNR